MRLYAYEDRYGDERFGVLVLGRLLTGSQLEKRGGLDPAVDTHLGIGYQLAFQDGWLGEVARATKRALKKGAPLLDLDTRRPVAAISPGGLGEKIVCAGLNYADHVSEGGGAAPERPMLFMKSANAIVGDGDAIVRPPGTRALDLEVELGVVIGRSARRVTPEEAVDCIAGYVVVNDVSARDWQGKSEALREGEKGDGQWLRAKGSDTFLPVGPVFATPDEVDPEAGLAIRSWHVPGEGPGAGVPVLMQDGNTRHMLASAARLISLISQQVTLRPSDLVATGTPAGVGVFRDPPVFLEPGDLVRCEIEGIGMVENPIVDWTDDPRQDL